MARLKFGCFLAPHHPIGENPTLQFQRDLALAAQVDSLGYDEFWCGEHHSTGWETIASPEMFLAAAAQHTHRIKLGTGVIFIAIPSSVQRCPAHRAARSHESGPCDFRLRTGRTAIRCVHAQYRPDGPA